MAAITIGAIYLFVVRLGASLSSTLLALCLLAAALSVMVLLIEMAARPYGTWTRERTANTLILLFLTPLSSREILRGRLVGGLLYALNVHMPLLLAGTCGIIWITLRGAWMVLPFLLALSPLAALFAVVLASTIRPQVGAPWTWRLDEWLEVVLSIGQVVILFVAIVVLANLAGTNQALTWLSALGFFAVNTAIVWACYLIRVRQFETLRCGEREVPLR